MTTDVISPPVERGPEAGTVALDAVVHTRGPGGERAHEIVVVKTPAAQVIGLLTR